MAQTGIQVSNDVIAGEKTDRSLIVAPSPDSIAPAPTAVFSLPSNDELRVVRLKGVTHTRSHW
jgi:hypothetical protein